MSCCSWSLHLTRMAVHWCRCKGFKFDNSCSAQQVVCAEQIARVHLRSGKQKCLVSTAASTQQEGLYTGVDATSLTTTAVHQQAVSVQQAVCAKQSAHLHMHGGNDAALPDDGSYRHSVTSTAH